MCLFHHTVQYFRYFKPRFTAHKTVHFFFKADPVAHDLRAKMGNKLKRKKKFSSFYHSMIIFFFFFFFFFWGGGGGGNLYI